MISFIGGYSKTYNTSTETIYNYDDVKNSLIRFHVLANSDSKHWATASRWVNYMTDEPRFRMEDMLVN